MIVDSIENAECYYGLGERLTAALRFLQTNDCTALAGGRHTIRGSQIFALVQDYQTKQPAEARWVAHRKYIDVLYIAEGVERIGYAELSRMQLVQDYDAENDVLFLDGDGDQITVRAGVFVILGPADVHKPCLVADQVCDVRKVVVKVAV